MLDLSDTDTTATTCVLLQSLMKVSGPAGIDTGMKSGYFMMMFSLN